LPTAEKIFFNILQKKGKIEYPVQRVNVDFTVEMLAELDKAASELNVSRQALIKTYLRQALDQHYLATELISIEISNAYKLLYNTEIEKNRVIA